MKKNVGYLILVSLLVMSTSTPVKANNEALIKAISFGRLDDLKTLIGNGVDINQRFDMKNQNNSFYITPLMYAILCGNSNIVSVLLVNGADPDAKVENTNITTQQLAFESGNATIVQLIKECQWS